MARSVVERKDRFFAANRSVVEYEIKPAHTITFLADVDLTQVEALRRAAGENKPSYTSFVVKAGALLLKEMPYCNRRVCRLPQFLFLVKGLQRFTHSDVAVAAERDAPGNEYAMFADVIRDADEKSLTEINTWLRALAASDENSNAQWRIYSNLIRRLPHWFSTPLIRMPVFIPSLWEKYRGAALMVSSPAKYGVDCVMTVWTSPMGISFGYVKDRPRVRDGQVVACPSMMVTMNFDRRVMTGAPGARVFKRLVDLLENAQTELTDGGRRDAAGAAPPAAA